MIVYPAIDLSQGACVRLRQGAFVDKTVYSREPLERARAFARAGARWLHVVDLDGAEAGAAAQTETILELARGTTSKMQVGGGIRDAAYIETLLSGGVDRVVVGSRAVDAPDETRKWIERFGPERVVLAFDVRLTNGVPFPATRGWRTDSETSLTEWLAQYRGSGLRYVLCTDVARDGMLAGPNVALYAEIRSRFPEIEVLASGGVSTLDDLRALKRIPVSGVVVGKALYENRLTLSEALALTC